MALRDRLRDLSAQAQRDVWSLFDRWQGGGITEAEFIAAAAAAIARADSRAAQTADRAMAIQLSRALRRPVDPEPTDLGEQQPRLRDSVTTLLSERPEIATTAALLAASQRARLGRLARSEPLSVGQTAVQTNLRRTGAGWVRATGADPCPLCQDWDDGVVRPADVPMAHHPNCSCVQRPARL